MGGSARRREGVGEGSLGAKLPVNPVGKGSTRTFAAVMFLSAVSWLLTQGGKLTGWGSCRTPCEWSIRARSAT